MRNKIRDAIRKIIYKERSSSKAYLDFLRKIGCRIGEDVTIYVPTRTSIDITRPWLISIGNHVQITEGVTILTHGYDWSVLKKLYGDVLGSAGEVKIGSNVFIGMHTTILKNVSIGDNVVIGANSLVNKDIPANCVAAGNPCQVIMSIEEYYEKRKSVQYKEAVELVRLYRDRFSREVDDDALREFFWLFEDDPYKLPEKWKAVMRLCGNEYISNKKMQGHKPIFDDRQSFLNSIPWR